MSGQVRTIEVRLELAGGHSHDVRLREDSSELRALFTALAERGSAGAAITTPLLQIPLQEGRSACSFLASDLVSIVTNPPVLVRLEEAPQPQASPPRAPAAMPVAAARIAVVIDDFLGPDEHAAMLSLALRSEDRFEKATVQAKESAHRRNSVFYGFAETPHARLVTNRILVWYPLLARRLATALVALTNVESQLTASNEGDYYRMHLDADHDGDNYRLLSCVYYFHKSPRGFAGGSLRVHETFEEGDQIHRTGGYTDVEPRSNRLVVFPSRAYHELLPIRCPSGTFPDSRFAVTTWLHAGPAPDPRARFGFGYFDLAGLPGRSGTAGAAS